jgi:hypothetical protein
VELAVYNNSNWNIQTVTSNMGSLGNLVLDSKGRPHFIYAHDYSESNNTIVYVSWNGAVWNAQDVVSNVSGGGTGATMGIYTMANLALDSHDYPHIAYVNSPGWGSLEYASWTGTAWEFQTVNSTIVAQSCWLAVDSNGNPHVSLIGFIEGSGAGRFTGFYTWTAPIMYATANETKPVLPPSSTEPSSPTFSDFVLSLIVSVIIVATVVAVVVEVLVYFKKRKR